MLLPKLQMDNVFFSITPMDLTTPVHIHKHSYVEIVFITDGTATQIIDDKKFSSYKGCVTIIHPECSHGFEKVHNLKHFNITCSPEFLKELGSTLIMWRGRERIFDGKYRFANFQINSMLFYDIQNILQNMNEIYYGNGKDREVKMRSYFGILLILLVQSYQPPTISANFSIEDVANYINKHFQEKLTLKFLAQKSGMSTTLFLMKFKEKFNTSPIKYLNEVRMNHACNLLENTNLPIKEIAYESGFYDSNYFIKLFKREFRVSPAKNRNSRNII